MNVVFKTLIFSLVHVVQIFNDLSYGSQVFSKAISSIWNSYKLKIEQFEESFKAL